MLVGIDVGRFHPKVQEMIKTFPGVVETWLIQFTDLVGQSIATKRPITLSQSLKIGASVKRAKDGWPEYTVSLGTIFSITDIAFTVSAREDFFAEFGTDRGAIRTQNHRGPNHFSDYEFLRGSSGRKSRPAVPFLPTVLIRNPVIAGLAQVLIDLAGRFIMQHEQYHFLRGHLHYLRGVESPEAYDEVPDGRVVAFEAEKRRALELDADGSSLGRLLELDQANRKVVLGEFAAHANTDWIWVRLVAAAASIVMIALSSAEEPNLDLAARCHPSVEARILNLFWFLEQHSREHGRLASAEDWEQTVRMFRGIAAVADVMGVEPPAMESYPEWKNARPEEYRHRACIELRDNLIVFREILPHLR